MAEEVCKKWSLVKTAISDNYNFLLSLFSHTSLFLPFSYVSVCLLDSLSVFFQKGEQAAVSLQEVTGTLVAKNDLVRILLPATRPRAFLGRHLYCRHGQLKVVKIFLILRITS
jgi:hypothetical protein